MKQTYKVTAVHRKTGKLLQSVYLTASDYRNGERGGRELLKVMGNKNFYTRTSIYYPLQDRDLVAAGFVRAI